MIFRLSRRDFLASTAAAALVAASPVRAEDSGAKVVEMLNKHPEDSKKRNVFYPRVMSVQPGETVLFKATDRGHNSSSIEGMIPDGVEEWDSRINEEIEVTFETPGIYGYKCTPHSSIGMVGLIVVEGEGKLDNLEAAKEVRQRGRAKSEWEEIWAEAEEMGLLSESSA
ncbi:MAG: pseudoazurin [Pseudomonadota bacterium]